MCVGAVQFVCETKSENRKQRKAREGVYARIQGEKKIGKTKTRQTVTGDLLAQVGQWTKWLVIKTRDPRAACKSII